MGDMLGLLFGVLGHHSATSGFSSMKPVKMYDLMGTLVGPEPTHTEGTVPGSSVLTFVLGFANL